MTDHAATHPFMVALDAYVDARIAYRTRSEPRTTHKDVLDAHLALQERLEELLRPENLANAFASFAASIERREDLIEDLVDRLYELWQEHGAGMSFHDFAGLTWEQYSAYVELRYEAEDLRPREREKGPAGS